MRHLKKVLDEHIENEEVKALVLAAAKKDFEAGNKTGDKEEVAEILPMFNEIFSRRSRLMPKNVINRYKEILRHYSVDELRDAMMAAKEDEYHMETGYKYCTLEYFSRLNQIDKWLNVAQSKKDGSTFTMPKMNIK